MSVNLITGNLFSPIQASQDSDYQAGTFGEKTQILNVGSKMAVSIVDNSTIRCEDGVLVTKEGRRVQIDNGDVVEWTIPTGTQGTTSYYIVGFRLYTDDESAQLCDTFVQSVAGSGATIAEDTFRDGAVEIFVSVARVVQNGITLDSIQPLIPAAMTTDDAKSAISRINSNLIETNSKLTHSTCTNLLNPTARTQTINGVTFTNNGDGTYTVNGTASAFAIIIQPNYLDLTPFRGKFIRIVGCPSGGGADKYQFNINIIDASGTTLGQVVDFGEGETFHVPSNAHRCNIIIGVRNNYTANNLLFKPMITTDLNAKYDDYVPYTGGSGRLNEDVSRINSDLTDYSEFTISVGGDTETIRIQKCYKKGNKIHIEFMASRTSDASLDSIWGIIPSQYRPTQNIRTGIMSRSDVNFTVSCGCVIEASPGYIRNASYNSIPANTTMVFYIEYPIN